MSAPLTTPLLLCKMVALLPDAALLIADDGRILAANERAGELFGYGDDGLTGLTLEQLVPDEQRERHVALRSGFVATPREQAARSGRSMRGLRRDGSSFPAEISLGTIRRGGAAYVLATVRDVTDQRRAEESLLLTNRALRLLSASNQTLIRSGGEQELLQQVCRIAVEVGGYRLAWVGFKEQDALRSVRPVAWVGYEDGFMQAARMSWEENERGRSAMSTAIRTGTVQLRQDILNDPRLTPWHADARARNYQSAIALPLKIEGRVIGAMAIYAPEPDAFLEQEVELLSELADDLSFGIQAARLREAHYQAEAHVHQLAYYDRLTGLPNRTLFLDHLAEVLKDAAIGGHRIMLLLMDLNRLREINETHGHDIGDQLLVKVAWHLQRVCGPDLFLARFGGDDFAVIYPDADQDAAAALACRMLAAVAQPTRLGDQQFVLSGCVGIAGCPEDSTSAHELVSQVDLAMSRAKDGGSSYRFYHAEMSAVLTRRLELVHRLELALEGGAGLQLYYQPKVDLAGGRVCGAEALLRWSDPLLGWVSPAEFIPVAEQRGMMERLGGWVLREACRQLRVWLDMGISCCGRLAINISTKQLDSPDFIAFLTGVLLEQGVDASHLELELTESSLMADPEHVAALLAELKQLGFSLAIDDFGTGYSSLVYLKRFPIDTLKIDQTFVRDMLVDQNDHAIITTIVAIAQQLGLQLVAEGVEEEGQQQALLELGCATAQGFFFSRPLPADQFVQKLVNRVPSPS